MIGRRQTKELVKEALEMAAGKNPQRPEGAVYHSDRGSQYTAKAIKELVEELGLRKSMSRPGRPNDNQPIESFWHTMEIEMEDISRKTYEESKRIIARYIEIYYNAERIHSGIGYETPNAYFTLHGVHYS